VSEHQESVFRTTWTEAPPAAVHEIGEITCRVISDGGMNYGLDGLYPGAPEPELSEGLAGRLTANGELPIPYRCLLVETPTHTVLIDTGLGPYAAQVGAPAGQLLDHLSGAGFSADDIDVVVLTHAHPDHFGGLVADGRLVFGRARHVMSEVEWAHWTSEDELARLPEMLAVPARQVLPVVGRADVLDLTRGDTEIVPGVHLVPAPGHTVGHCSVSLTSGQEQAVFLADAILDDLHLTHPEWVSAYDMDPDQTVATRTRLFEQAERDASLVLAFHLAAAGHLERGSQGYRIVG
jgi:glyoxylase-like metal-dependent hydrolase (beta-lactamase superfamily II)